MAVSGFSKAILFIGFLLCIVSSVHAANCDELVLRLNGKNTKKTKFSLSEKHRFTKIRCNCEDETQVVKWYYNNSTSEVPAQNTQRSEQVFTTERDEPLTGTILWISRDASPDEYAGAYRCQSVDTSNRTSFTITSITIVVKASYEVTVSPVTTEVIVKDGNESLTLMCDIMGLYGGTVQWTKDGSIISNSIRHIVNTDDDSSSNLQIKNLTKTDEGSYQCVYELYGDSFISNNATVSIKVLPRILVHPKTMRYVIETEDDQITLSCTVDGEGVVYWQKDGVNISGSEMPITPGGNTLDIAPDNITDTSVGMYRCIASNNIGSVVSNAASITVTGVITVTIEPSDLTVVEVNTEAQFDCEASGYKSDVFMYQWKLNGTDIADATDSSLTISSADIMQSGRYVCSVTNHWGEVEDSNPTDLIVTTYKAEIILENTSVEVGTRVSLTCKATGYQSDMFEYQWSHNGVSITGATNVEYIIESADESDSGIYLCTVTNTLNKTFNTSKVQLNATRSPPVISAHPMDASVILHYGNESVMFSCEANGGNSVHYTWFTGTTDDSEMIEGATSNILTLSSVTVNMNNTQYYCVAGNNGGSVNSNTAYLTITIFIEANIQPADVTAEVTTEVFFECVAEGYRPDTFKYQWTFNGTEIADATENILMFSSVSEDQNGMYKCVVINYWNMTANSAPSQLTVTRNPPVITTHPMDTTVLLRHGNQNVTFSCEANVEADQYTWFTGDNKMIEGVTSNTLVLGPVTIDMNNTQYYCVASNNSGNHTSNRAHLIVDYAFGLPVITEHPLKNMNYIINSSSDQITLNCAVDGEGVVYWQKDGVNISGSEMPITPGGNTLDIAPDSIADTSVGMYRCIASNIVGSVMSNSTSVTVTGAIQVTIEEGDRSVEVTTEVPFTCKASGYQSDKFTYKWRVNQADIVGATSSSYIIPSVDETSRGMYECIVANHWSEMDTSAPVQLNVTRNPPIIVMGPQNLTVLITSDDPGKVQFNCVTEERAEHQWFKDGKKAGNVRMDKMSSGYHVNITLSHNGTQVYCEASNGSGTVQSEVATLTTLVPPPVITENPEILVNSTAGNTVTFQCKAKSFGSEQLLEYHWLKVLDNHTTVLIDGATSNTLQFTAVPVDDSTFYQCEVTNENGTVFSTIGRLNLLPSITVQPENIHVDLNATATLYCEAVGGNNITYQWIKNDTIVQSPQENGNLIIDSVQQTDEGSYQCEAMNDRDEVAVSNEAKLIVYDQFLLDINVTDEEYFVLEGADVYISCDVIIEPRPPGQIDVAWYRKDTNDDLSSVSEVVEMNETSHLILHLKNISKEDKGMYVCSVDDGNAEDRVNISTNVIVEYPPTITEFAEVDPIRVGENLDLLCTANGVPTPILTVYKEGEIVASLPGGYLTHTITSASSRDDHGMYTCTARSTSKATGQLLPVASKTIQVIVQGVPDKINKQNKLEYNPVSLTSVNLTWGQPFDNNNPIIGYIVSCDKCSTASTVVDANVTNLVINGLTPGVEYEFNVVAVNSLGKGPDSNTVNALSATPESAVVTNLDAAAVTEVSVVVAWTDPELYALMIKEYTIHAVGDRDYEVVTVPAGQHEVNITDLVPSFSYNISVVVTYQLASFMSTEVIYSVTLPECEGCVEPVIMQPTNKNLTDLSFTLEWSPVNNIELLQNYSLSYYSVSHLSVEKRQIDSQTVSIPAGSTSYTVDNLIPYSEYCFSLEAIYAQKGIVFSNKMSEEICDINTPPIESSEPLNLKVKDIDFTSLTISWTAPVEKYGIINNYKVYYSNNGVTDSQLTDDAKNLEFQITNLSPGRQYRISVAAVTYYPYGDDMEGPMSDAVDVRTSFTAPVLVTSLFPVTSTDAVKLTAVITIPYIDASHGEMSHYLVVMVIGSLPSRFSAPSDIPDDQLLPYDDAIEAGYNYYVATGGRSVNFTHTLGNEDRTTVNSIQYNNKRLTADQQYAYFVRVYSKYNMTVYSTSELSESFVITSDEEETSTSWGFVIGGVAAACVIIIIILIVLIAIMTRLNSSKNTNKEAPMRDLPSPTKVQEQNSLSAAPELERRLSVPFINAQYVEATTSTGSSTTLSIEVGGKPQPEVQWFKDNNPVIHRVLPDGALYIEKTSIKDEGKYTVRVTNTAGQSEQSVHLTVLEPSPPEGDSGHNPIPVEDFAQHVALNRSNMEELFIKEYKDLEVDQMFTQHNARIPINRSKNRYINIIPYDHSRVPLEMDYEVTGSDYINASFVDGYCRSNEYIATQGPLTSTFGDFWQMIWERKCTTIVMLTNLKEDDKIKCHQYWPSYGSATYSNHKVTLKSVESLAEYCIRVFTVEQVNDKENNTLEVHQFHYTVWPDHGVPDFGTPLLSFHSRVEKFYKRGGAPMVVHCSAGVGRTGTFIVIDTQLQRIKDLSNIDIFNNVRMLRYCRNYMVQTQSQYSFLHNVMLEAIMCGDTSLGAPVQNIVDRLRDLATVDPDTNQTSFEKQFKMLDSDVLQERKFTYTYATAPKNAAKNRYQNHYAADQNFVCLSSTYDKPDYINASFVDGYRLRNAFIVTQGPMENTVNDFWQMIWEQKSHAIVMLTSLEENEIEQCHQYWPDEGTKEYGSYVVEVLKLNEPFGGQLTREFKLSHISKPMECRVITQFHYMNWPMDSCPENGSSIIDLIESVERVQRKTGNGPITVHCNDGVGRSGTFCALVSSLERFKAEQMADIFQTIKKMRMQRAGMVQTPEQYEFLHKTLLEAIERFDTYSNFT